MPIQRVEKNGKTGYRWGQQGHIYYGAGARAKALLQQRAARAAGWKEPNKAAAR